MGADSWVLSCGEGSLGWCELEALQPQKQPPRGVSFTELRLSTAWLGSTCHGNDQDRAGLLRPNCWGPLVGASTAHQSRTLVPAPPPTRPLPRTLQAERGEEGASDDALPTRAEVSTRSQTHHQAASPTLHPSFPARGPASIPPGSSSMLAACPRSSSPAEPRGGCWGTAQKAEVAALTRGCWWV